MISKYMVSVIIALLLASNSAQTSESNLGTVEGFYRDKNKCYCNGDMSGGKYRIESEYKKDLERRAPYPVHDVGNTVSLIHLPSSLKSSEDAGTTKDLVSIYEKECKTESTNNEAKCWVKNSYVDIVGRKLEVSKSSLNSERRKCEEQGTMMGAEACED